MTDGDEINGLFPDAWDWIKAAASLGATAAVLFLLLKWW